VVFIYSGSAARAGPNGAVIATPSKSGAGYPGQLGLNGSTSQFGAITFLVKQLQGLFRTCTLVRVEKCTNSGGVSPIGFVDVTPIVNMVDGLMKGSEHGKVYGLPYARVQGGRNAVICDPCKGDLGVAVISDRDISTVKKTKKVGNPGSRRRGDLADGLYLFTVLAEDAPQQYVRFLLDDDGAPNGMELVDKFSNTIVMDTDGIKINGVLFDRDQNVSEAQKIDAKDEITAKSGSGSSVTLTGHDHGGVQTGSGHTAPPTGGT